LILPLKEGPDEMMDVLPTVQLASLFVYQVKAGYLKVF
jgi:hypothetical protein